MTVTLPQCLMDIHVQDRLSRYTVLNSDDNTAVLLDSLFKYSPSERGRQNVAIEITSCDDDGELYRLGQRYFNGLILPSKFTLNKKLFLSMISLSVRAQGGKTPPISHPSRPSANINAENMEHLTGTAEGDQQRLKELVCLPYPLSFYLRPLFLGPSSRWLPLCSFAHMGCCFCLTRIPSGAYRRRRRCN
jgi:hypothetical protein